MKEGTDQREKLGEREERRKKILRDGVKKSRKVCESVKRTRNRRDEVVLLKENLVILREFRNERWDPRIETMQKGETTKRSKK